MNANPSREIACANENCVRAAEPGEPYCGTCGLELSLYDREERLRRLPDAPAESRQASRR